MKTRGFDKISLIQWLTDNNCYVTTATEHQVTELTDKHNKLILPKRSTKNSAGYDIFSPIDFTLGVGGSIKIPTGFKAYMLPDEFLSFYPRSGLGFKYFLRLANTVGIGDSDYYNNPDNEGHYWLKIRNEGDMEIVVKTGDRIAQCIFQKYLLADEDNTSEDRIGGLGSTKN